MKRRLTAFIAASLWTTASVAEDSEFTIDPKLVDKLFESSVKREEKPLPRANLKVEAGYGQFLPSALTLQNQYYEIAYADGVSSLPLGNLRVGRTVGTLASATMSLFGQVGYSYTQDHYSVESKTGIALRDAVTLQWVPLQIGLSADFGQLGSRYLKFGAQAAAGADWLNQSGTLDGTEQTFWLPTVIAGPEITAFPTDESRGGFDGITVSSEYRATVSSAQQLSGWGWRVTTGYVM